MPLGTCTTCSTPFTAFAFAASNDFTFAPKTGARATSAVRRPGSRASMPNFALPVIFSGVSSRRVALPISFHSLRSLSATSFGGASLCAAAASAP